jgi:hypothetical protein
MRTRGRNFSSGTKRTSAWRRDWNRSKSVASAHASDSECCGWCYLPSSSRRGGMADVFSPDLLPSGWEQPLHYTWVRRTP